MNIIKQQLFEACQDYVKERENTVQEIISSNQKALHSETKSSAGDKHETGRAMLQLEREKAGNQLSEIVKVKEALSKISVENTSQTIGLGSVVYTTKANYYIAISAGELIIGKDKFYAISPNTPIGKLLISKTIGDAVSFRELSFEVNQVI